MTSTSASALPLAACRARALSSQPNSTWPRMREPAATVSVPALRSPMSTPPSSSSTRCADSMLPSSSPAIIDLAGTHAAVDLGAVLRWSGRPATLTSPLNWPAMRTWPAPSILPSMVRSAAMRDSLASRARPRAGRARARRASMLESGVEIGGISLERGSRARLGRPRAAANVSRLAGGWSVEDRHGANSLRAVIRDCEPLEATHAGSRTPAVTRLTAISDREHVGRSCRAITRSRESRRRARDP